MSVNPAAANVKMTSSKDISGDPSASKKAKDPGVQAEQTQWVRKSSSRKNKKNKKHCRGGEEDAGNAPSAGAARCPSSSFLSLVPT